MAWTNTHFDALDPQDKLLLQAAREVSVHAYCPYSGFSVGAALRTASGKVFTGCNMENASYGLTMCAEVAALTRAVSEGEFTVTAMAVVGAPQIAGSATGGEQTRSNAPRAASDADNGPVTPCGRCRQLILEAAHVTQDDVRILCGSHSSAVAITSIHHLLPHGFGPLNLR